MDFSNLHKTPLFLEHQKLGAQIVDFGGWAMPVQYTNVIYEHHCTRTKAGLYDICHMGEIFLKGPEALALLNYVVSRNIEKLEIGQIFLAVMCNEQGGIIDDLTVYRLAKEEYMLVTNASTRYKDYLWLLKVKKDKGFNLEIDDQSSQTAKLDIQGPKSEEILTKLTSVNLKAIPFYRFSKGKVNGIETIVSRSGYTGEIGFELYFSADKAGKMWNRLLEIGKTFGLQPIGLGARDTLRIECAMMLYGSDINEETTPLEARYGWAVEFDHDFIGKEALVKQKNEGVLQKLVGFEMLDRAIPRHDYLIFKKGQKIGRVTSGTFAPTLQKSVGMGYVACEYKENGTEIEILIRNKTYRARVVACPFYKRA